MHAAYMPDPIIKRTGKPLGFDWAGRDVLHLADNQSANCGIVNGGTAQPDMARIVAAMRLRLARLRIRLWVDFVKSEANFADDPSRRKFDLLDRLGAIEVEYQMPPYQKWGEQ